MLTHELLLKDTRQLTSEASKLAVCALCALCAYLSMTEEAALLELLSELISHVLHLHLLCLTSRQAVCSPIIAAANIPCTTVACRGGSSREEYTHTVSML